MNAPPSFSWDQIESADYREYVANLRAVGCPEEVVRDLVTAELNQLFAPRVAAVSPEQCRLYWQKCRNEQPGLTQARRLQALHEEQAGIFKEITGAGFEPQSFIDALFAQVWGAEQELLYLPEERSRVALEALTASDYEQNVMKGQVEDQNYSHSEAFFEEKCNTLAAVLTPAELEEYRLRNSPQAMNLRAYVQYFDCTPEEFKALLGLWARISKARRQFEDPSARAEEVSSLFGEERAKQFARLTDMFYANARRTAEECGWPVEQAESAWQITYDARVKAHRIATDASLSADARKQRLQELLQEADAAIKAVLGEKPSRSLRRDLTMVLRPFEAKRGCCGNRQ
jgi:hypothetical protein